MRWSRGQTNRKYEAVLIACDFGGMPRARGVFHEQHATGREASRRTIASRHLALAVGCDKNRATWSGVRGIASPIGRGTDPKAAIGYQELSEMKWVRGECRETDAELEMDISEVRCTMLV